MRAMVLGPLPWNAPQSGLRVDLLPSHAAHLLAPLTGDDQKAQDPPVVVRPASRPDRLQLVIRQDALARSLRHRAIRAHNRVGFRQSLPHGPAVEARERSPGPIGGENR